MSTRNRSAIPDRYKWDLTKIYPSDADWEKELQRVQDAIRELTLFRGRIGESPRSLLDFILLLGEGWLLAHRLGCAGWLARLLELKSEGASEKISRIEAVSQALVEASASFESEIKELGDERARRYFSELGELEPYRHLVEDILRRKEHIGNADVERALYLLSQSSWAPAAIYNRLRDADLAYEPIGASDQREIPVSDGVIDMLLADRKREVRKQAWHSYTSEFLAHRESLTECYTTYARGRIAYAKISHYPSGLEKYLDAENISLALLDAARSAFERHHKLWHRYVRVRCKALNLSRISLFDLHAPLSEAELELDYEKTIELILASVAPLGEEYRTPLEAGLRLDRWVDLYPSDSKQGSALCGGVYRVSPYVLMNFSDTLSEASTLAHELGHAMHFHFSCGAQPFLNSGFGFSSEFPSNLGQALLREELLSKFKDRGSRLAVLDETFANLHRYLCVMPILANVEWNTFQRLERGEAVTSTYLSNLTCELLTKAYGDGLEIDRERDGIFWAQFSHLYSPLYPYSYIVGIAAATTVAPRLVRGDQALVRSYIEMLKAGRSKHALELFAMVGINPLAPELYDGAYRELEQHIKMLEELIG